MCVLLDVVVADGEALVDECLKNRVCHLFRGVPHAVKDNDGTLLGLAERPLVVEVDDLGDV